jgi:hypothetical protein
MKTNQIGWAAWAMAPVLVLAFHFGPGQRAFVQDKAASIQSAALDLEERAKQLQDAAYAKHLIGIEARREATSNPSPDGEAKASLATAEEDAAYATAADAWQQVADKLIQVEQVLGTERTPQSDQIKLAKSKALVRAGDVWGGINELETLLATAQEEVTKVAKSDEFTAQVREELATAYYYGARLLRLSGLSPQEWMVESSKARQQFRYLAEQENAEASQVHQQNLELVLNLEQSALNEIQGRPLPKESPKACKLGNRNNVAKSKRPPQNKNDARGAGGADDIPDGW